LGNNLKPANFIFTEAAIAQLAVIRADYDAWFPDDKAEMLAISVGWPVAPDGKEGPAQVSPAYWRKSEFSEAARELVQRVSGVDLIFGAPEPYSALFEGMVVDYAPDRAFFLRPPAGHER
jgi:hypothetical protein